MEKIQSYRMLSDIDEMCLSRRINEMIEQGWQPYGPPYIFPMHGSSYTNYVQAMVLYEKNVGFRND